MPSVSSPSKSPSLDSEASTIVFDLDSDDSLSSSIFGYTCEICHWRAQNSTELELKYL